MVSTPQEIAARGQYFEKHGAKIDYEEVMKLGGKRHQCSDPVWKREMGYDYFFVTLKLTKRTYLEWSPEDKLAILTKIDRDHNVIFEIPMQNLHMMRVLVQFYQAKKDTGRLVGLLMKEEDMPKPCTCPQTTLLA